MNSIYYLSLSNNENWQLCGNASSLLWLQNFSPIMGLTKSRANNFNIENTTTIIFTRDNEYLSLIKDFYHIDSNFYETNCYVHDLGALRIKYYFDLPLIICDLSNFEKEEQDFLMMSQAIIPIFNQSINKGGLPMHAALLEFNKKGILIAAPGNTGKSTCCRRVVNPWHALCDDESLIVKDINGNFRVHPFPTWSDYLWKDSNKTYDVQYNLPLTSIFFLQQAFDDSVELLNKGKAAMCIYDSALQASYRNTWNLSPDKQIALKKEIFNNACDIAKRVPSFILNASIDGKFWNNIEKALSDNNLLSL